MIALCLSCSALSTCDDHAGVTQLYVEQKDCHPHQHIKVGGSAYHELCTFGILLSDLLGLHCGRVITAESQLSDGNIIKNDIEVPRPLREDPPDVPADHLS